MPRRLLAVFALLIVVPVTGADNGQRGEIGRQRPLVARDQAITPDELSNAAHRLRGRSYRAVELSMGEPDHITVAAKFAIDYEYELPNGRLSVCFVENRVQHLEFVVRRRR